MAEASPPKDKVWSLPPEAFSRPPAADRPTPYVEVDSARLERNLSAMQARANDAGVRLRPHLKTHKSLEIGRRQIALGAVGLTAAKPSEAETFVEAGFSDITLAYPVVRADSLDRLLECARPGNARINVIAADAIGVDALATAAHRHGSRLACFLKVDVGLGRVGVKPSDPEAVALARRIAASSDLVFAGLLSHAGHVYAAADADAVRSAAERESLDLLALKARLEAAGLAVPVVSTGATPTVLGAPIQPGADEIRPGNYVFLDLTALRLGVCSPDQLSLSVVARVVAANDRHAIVDAGSKTLSSDLGPHGIGGAGYGAATDAEAGRAGSLLAVERLSEEHGFVAHRGAPPMPGTLVRIFPNHACAVVAQVDSFLLRDADRGETTSPVDARGCLT